MSLLTQLSGETSQYSSARRYNFGLGQQLGGSFILGAQESFTATGTHFARKVWAGHQAEKRGEEKVTEEYVREKYGRDFDYDPDEYAGQTELRYNYWLRRQKAERRSRTDGKFGGAANFLAGMAGNAIMPVDAAMMFAPTTVLTTSLKAASTMQRTGRSFAGFKRVLDAVHQSERLNRLTKVSSIIEKSQLTKGSRTLGMALRANVKMNIGEQAMENSAVWAMSDYTGRDYGALDMVADTVFGSFLNTVITSVGAIRMNAAARQYGRQITDEAAFQTFLSGGQYTEILRGTMRYGEELDLAVSLDPEIIDIMNKPIADVTNEEQARVAEFLDRNSGEIWLTKLRGLVPLDPNKPILIARQEQAARMEDLVRAEASGDYSGLGQQELDILFESGREVPMEVATGDAAQSSIQEKIQAEIQAIPSKAGLKRSLKSSAKRVDQINKIIEAKTGDETSLKRELETLEIKQRLVRAELAVRPKGAAPKGISHTDADGNEDGVSEVLNGSFQVSSDETALINRIKELPKSLRDRFKITKGETGDRQVGDLVEGAMIENQVGNSSASNEIEILVENAHAALKAREDTAAREKEYEYMGKTEAAFLDNEWRSASQKTKKGTRMGDLEVGESFRIRGEQFTVEGFTEDGRMTVKDGREFNISPDTVVYVDRGQIQAAERVDPDMDPFDGKSVEEYITDSLTAGRAIPHDIFEEYGFSIPEGYRVMKNGMVEPKPTRSKKSKGSTHPSKLELVKSELDRNPDGSLKATVFEDVRTDQLDMKMSEAEATGDPKGEATAEVRAEMTRARSKIAALEAKKEAAIKSSEETGNMEEVEIIVPAAKEGDKSSTRYVPITEAIDDQIAFENQRISELAEKETKIREATLEAQNTESKVERASENLKNRLDAAQAEAETQQQASEAAESKDVVEGAGKKPNSKDIILSMFPASMRSFISSKLSYNFEKKLDSSASRISAEDIDAILPEGISVESRTHYSSLIRMLHAKTFFGSQLLERLEYDGVFEGQSKAFDELIAKNDKYREDYNYFKYQVELEKMSPTEAAAGLYARIEQDVHSDILSDIHDSNIVRTHSIANADGKMNPMKYLMSLMEGRARRGIHMGRSSVEAKKNVRMYMDQAHLNNVLVKYDMLDIFDGVAIAGGGRITPRALQTPKSKDVVAIYGDNMVEASDMFWEHLTEAHETGVIPEVWKGHEGFKEVLEAVKATHMNQINALRQTGANITLRESHLGLAQRWDDMTISKAGLLAFMEDMRFMLDIQATKEAHGGKLPNGDDWDTDTFIEQWFHEIQEPKGKDHPSMNISRSLSATRKIHLKKGQELKALKKYSGHKHMGILFRDQIRYRSEMIVMAEQFGNKPKENFERIKEAVGLDSASLVGQQRISLARLDGTFDFITGSLDNPVNKGMARMFRKSRQVSNIWFLGGSGISALNDVPVATLTLQEMGMSNSFFDRRFLSAYRKAHARNFAPDEMREYFSGQGAGGDAVLNAASRRVAISDGTRSDTLSKVHEASFVYNGLNFMTHAGQEAFVDVLTQDIARQIKAGGLSEQTLDVMAAFGINADEAATFKDALITTEDGHLRFDPSKLESREVDMKFREYMMHFMNDAIMTPDAGTQAMVRGYTQDGTFLGGAIRNIFQYMTFPVGMTNIVARKFISTYDGKSPWTTGRMGKMKMMGFIGSMLSMGYMSSILKDLAKGREPMDLLSMDQDEWQRVLRQSGILGILEPIYSGITMDPQGVVAPLPTTMAKGAGSIMSLEFGEAAHTFTRPFNNISVIGPAFNKALGSVFNESLGYMQQKSAASLESMTGQGSLF